MQLLKSHQFKRAEAPAAAAVFADQDDSPLARLAADLEVLQAEIAAPGPDALPAGAADHISRGAQGHAAMAALMLHDCRQRAANGTLNRLHLANLEKWIAGSRRWIVEQRAAYTAKTRRKFFLVKPSTASARRSTSGRM